MVIGVITEHSMSLTMAPVLVDLSKALALDKKALDGIRLTRTTASYKLTHGFARCLTEQLCEDLRKYPFSLNMDESTNNGNKKVLGMYQDFKNI